MITIEHLALAAKDTRALAEWYRDVLDFTIAYDSGEKPPAFFVQDPNGMAIEIVPPGPDGEVVDANANHLALFVEDFDAAHALMKSRGVEFEPEMSNFYFGGTRIAFFNDPEGHRVQIIWRKERLGG